MQYCIFCNAPAIAVINVGGATEALCSTHLTERRRQHEGNLTTHHITALGGPTDSQVALEDMTEQLRLTHRKVQDAKLETETALRALASMRAEQEADRQNFDQQTKRLLDRNLELSSRVRDLTAELSEYREPETSETGETVVEGSASEPTTTGAAGSDVSGA